MNLGRQRQSLPPDFKAKATTVSPTTVSGNTVVGEGISFDLTLTGGSPYTYICTFDTYDVVINNDTATVRIIPWTSGTLTGSITFDNQATCNITINVTEPAPTGGIQPTTLTTTMEGEDSKDIEYSLLPDTYDISTEDVVYDYESTGSSDFTSKITLSGDIDTETGNYVLTINTQNYSENTVTGTINVYAKIYDLQSSQLLRTYTATVNLTIEPI